MHPSRVHMMNQILTTETQTHVNKAVQRCRPSVLQSMMQEKLEMQMQMEMEMEVQMQMEMKMEMQMQMAMEMHMQMKMQMQVNVKRSCEWMQQQQRAVQCSRLSCAAAVWFGRHLLAAAPHCRPPDRCGGEGGGEGDGGEGGEPGGRVIGCQDWWVTLGVGGGGVTRLSLGCHQLHVLLLPRLLLLIPPSFPSHSGHSILLTPSHSPQAA